MWMTNRLTGLGRVAGVLTIMTMGAGIAEAAPDPSAITEAQLDNGMKVLVWPDHDIPNVALYIWFKVGSRNEAPGITGVSHFFEHMMFNGAKKYGPGDFDRVLEAAGGSNNAFTSNDVTVYQDWFPRDALPLVFDLESDRVGHLAFDPKMVASEREVVYSERRTSIDNDNDNLLDEQVRAVAFIAHPYRIPVIGWPSDIESWTIEDLRRHFKTYYAPNNAILVVVGDLTAEELLALAKKTLGKIEAQPAPRKVTTVEPRQQGQRRLVVEKDTQLAVVQASFHAPVPTTRSFAALELLESILLDGESSRLHRRLVEQERVAVEVSSLLDDGFDPGLLSIQVLVAEGVDPARVEAILFEELARVRKDGVTDSELSKARNQQLTMFYDALATINGKAFALGQYETFHGGWRELFTAPALYESVTADEVQAVAAEVLRVDGSTVGVLAPAPAPSGGNHEK